jgi:hypothetical protein
MAPKRKSSLAHDHFQKPSPASSNIHSLQAQHILLNGVVAPSPCDFCVLHLEGCVMASDKSFSKCAACTRRGQPCSHSQSSLRAWTSVVEGQEQLDHQIQAAERRFEDSCARHKESLTHLYEASAQLDEASAHLKNLKIRRSLLRARGDSLLANDTRLLEQEHIPSTGIITSSNVAFTPSSDSVVRSDLIASSAVPADPASSLGPIPGSSPLSDPSLELDHLLSSFGPPDLTFFGESQIPGPSLDN